MSGVFEGKTTGTPISLMVLNSDQKSKDYSNIMDVYRPGHADMGFDKKYGFRDYRGGGRSSGRETLARVAAGSVARKLLASLGIEVIAYATRIGEVEAENIDIAKRFNNQLCMPDDEAAERAAAVVEAAMKANDSVGGVVECVVRGLPIGVGEPVFDKLDACLAKAILSIGATKGIEFGAGFGAAQMYGSEDNDELFMRDGDIVKYSNNSGGVQGGFSDGSELKFRTVFKPTPSISKEQRTVNKYGEDTVISISGRHDPIIVPRAVVVVEAMTAVTLADLILTNMTARMDNIVKFYNV
jgi:chorismate synthase